MINNNFTKFNTTSEYNEFKASSAYTRPNVSWVLNENIILSEPFVPPLTSGIVIHKNGVFHEVSYNDFDVHYSDIVGSGYTIEGVIAVPALHTPDGTTRIISLKFMSTSTPDVGVSTSGNTTIYWGGSVNLTALTDYATVAKVTNVSGETTIGTSDYGYIPSDIFTGKQCVVDEKAKYHPEAEYVIDTVRYCPSPYLTGDEPNPLYRMTTVTNGLSDMDGSGNTEIIIANATAQTDWRTASTINNYNNRGYYPAACCCKRYGTSGIPSGSWYLPACGELGYVIARLSSINSLLTLIATKDPSLGAALLPSNDFWSSSEKTYDRALAVHFAQGYVRGSNKGIASLVRAFAAVNASALVF